MFNVSVYSIRGSPTSGVLLILGTLPLPRLLLLPSMIQSLDCQVYYLHICPLGKESAHFLLYSSSVRLCFVDSLQLFFN